MTRLLIRGLGAVIAACTFAVPLSARPVSYVDGWTFIGTSNRQSTAALLHYTATTNLSIGLRSEVDRRNDFALTALQPTYLVKRWFGSDYQGNVYAFGGLGFATATGDAPDNSGPGAFGGVMADWETRRLFAGYEARYLDAGDLGDNFMQTGRLGFAPYEGDTGDLHTWLMVEVDHRPEFDQPVGVTPLLRFFKGTALLELGYNLTASKPLLNFTYRF